MVYVFFFAETINEPSYILRVHLLEVHWNIMTLHDFYQNGNLPNTHIFQLIGKYLKNVWNSHNGNKSVMRENELEMYAQFLSILLIWLMSVYEFGC